MTSKIRFFPLVLIAGFFLASGAGVVLAENFIVLKGKSVRQGDSLRLSSNQVKLEREASIEKIEGTSLSFCVYQGKAAVVCSNPQHGVIGKRLGPGEYHVYTLVPDGRNDAFVILYLRYLPPPSR